MTATPKIINEFLDEWEEKANKYYVDLQKKRREERVPVTATERHIIAHPIKAIYRSDTGKCTCEGIDTIINKERQKKEKAFMHKLGFVGDIKKANLKIGVDGNLNGLVVGTAHSAEIRTIYAGGYNIQCLHYRVLVKPF